MYVCSPDDAHVRAGPQGLAIRREPLVVACLVHREAGQGEPWLSKRPIKPCQTHSGSELVLRKVRFAVDGRKQGGDEAGDWASRGRGRRTLVRGGYYLAFGSSRQRKAYIMLC